MLLIIHILCTHQKDRFSSTENDAILELEMKLAKIKTEVREIKKQLSIICFSLINEIKQSGKFDLSIITLFQYEFLFQTLKNKNSFPLQDIKIEKK